MANGKPGPSGLVTRGVAVVNRATVDLKVNFTTLVTALAHQITTEVAPEWGVSANLRIVDEKSGDKPQSGEWQLRFVDDADAAAKFGYHDITADGQPICYVFVEPTLEAEQKVSVTASHELLEMLIDPGAQMWAQAKDGVMYAYEACDAVEGEEYTLKGVPLSDFVYPTFFEYWRKSHAESPGAEVKFDRENKVSRPFQTLRRGYQIVSVGGAIGEQFGSQAKMRNFCETEDRTMHRSEYRVLRARYGAALRASGGDALDPRWRGLPGPLPPRDPNAPAWGGGPSPSSGDDPLDPGWGGLPPPLRASGDPLGPRWGGLPPQLPRAAVAKFASFAAEPNQPIRWR